MTLLVVVFILAVLGAWLTDDSFIAGIALVLFFVIIACL